MIDLARHTFDLATSINRALAESLRNAGPRVVVQVASLSATGIAPSPEPRMYPHCHADVFGSDGTLTITSMRGLTVREFVAGEWLDATAFGPDGHICYVLKPGVRRNV